LIEIDSCIADCRESMADPKGSKPSVVVDDTGVHPKNAINVTMEDLAKEDRKEVERQLKEEMAELRWRKLACFQKTRNGVIKKINPAAASKPKVDLSLSPEDLAQLVDVSVASKYNNDLTQFKRVIAENMHSTLETFKTDLNNNLPRQVRSVV
jgi:hypothetical protein